MLHPQPKSPVAPRKSLVPWFLLALLVASLPLAHMAGYMIAFWLLLVVFLSVVVYGACRPFSDASFYLGRNLPGSVRGATIDAVASSMPEFFITLFFLFLYGRYESGLATCAGSAIFNMALIPALCMMFIYGYRIRHDQEPVLRVTKPVVWRDGVFFVAGECLLIVFVWNGELTWWMGVILIGCYFGYLTWLWADARRHSRPLSAAAQQAVDAKCLRLTDAIRAGDAAALAELWPGFDESIHAAALAADPEAFWAALRGHLDGPPDCRGQGGESATLDLNGVGRKGIVRFTLRPDDGAASWVVTQMEAHEHTLVGAWTTIAVATAVVAVACKWLAESCENLSTLLDVSPYLVAVIIAAAATSVPDTILSILSARRGDDSGAVSNAFGSNIFNINIVLGVPLLIYAVWFGPVTVHAAEDVRELMVVLVALSTLTLWLFAVRYRLTRSKAAALIGFYALFVAYVVWKAAAS